MNTTTEVLKRLGLTDEQIARLRKRLGEKQRPKPQDKMQRRSADK